jgi:hypothetical protein
MTERKFNADVSVEQLRALLEYDPSTGILRWKVTRGGSARCGDTAGVTQATGYVVIMVSGKNYLAHRLAWAIVHGEWPTIYIDHIDGDRANNRIANFRLATRAQNGRNKPARGYSFVPKHRRYRAVIQVNGKNIHLGSFMEPAKAHAAYLAATKRYFGDFSVTNRTAEFV